MYQYTVEKELKRTYFVFTILGMFLLPKVLYTAKECKKVCSNYKRTYVNINKHSNIK